MASPNPSSKAADASLDAIPMKKSNPLVLFGIIGAVLLVQEDGRRQAQAEGERCGGFERRRPAGWDDA